MSFAVGEMSFAIGEMSFAPGEMSFGHFGWNEFPSKRTKKAWISTNFTTLIYLIIDAHHLVINSLKSTALALFPVRRLDLITQKSSASFIE